MGMEDGVIISVFARLMKFLDSKEIPSVRVLPIITDLPLHSLRIFGVTKKKKRKLGFVSKTSSWWKL